MNEIGIIGCGPRGLSALESIFKQAAHKKINIKVWIFEMTEYPGAGPVYDLNQPKSNWLNISERAIDIPARQEIIFREFCVPAFPDFQTWSNYNKYNYAYDEMDKFPLRSHLGEYLNERYHSISKILTVKGLMTMVKGEVDHVDITKEAISIKILGGRRFLVKEAVLCIGHQPVELDNQLADWRRNVLDSKSNVLYTKPYPVGQFAESSINNDSSCIAIRGFGLATIDVLRILTEGRGGDFNVIDESSRKMKYSKSGSEPIEIIPFSLDGLPMAPKPLNKMIDDYYLPSEEQLQKYRYEMLYFLESGFSLSSPKFLMIAIAPLIADIYMALGDKAIGHELTKDELNSIVIRWLEDNDFKHELILSKQLSSEYMMRQFVGMATGIKKVSLDFCAGHVWRHCQPTLYKLLSFAPLSDQVIADIVLLDERLKRYSYGPPVESLQQVLALIDVGLVNLDFVNNPDIKLNKHGWQINKSGESRIAKVMINSVLDAPQILKVVSALPKQLFIQSTFTAVHDKLGIQTRRDATVVSNSNFNSSQLSVLGRLAKGTIIGVDAIAECFGRRSEFWAEGVISRFRKC